MRMLLVLVVACGPGSDAPSVDAGPVDAPIGPVASDRAFDLVTCDANWHGAWGAPFDGVQCSAACADHTYVGHGTAVGCVAHTDTGIAISCNQDDAVDWVGWRGCCLTQPNYPYESNKPMLFALCDGQH